MTEPSYEAEHTRQDEAAITEQKEDEFENDSSSDQDEDVGKEEDEISLEDLEKELYEPTEMQKGSNNLYCFKRTVFYPAGWFHSQGFCIYKYFNVNGRLIRYNFEPSSFKNVIH